METGKFFFSYARADSEFVLKLAEDLRSSGINLWLDQLDIPGGVRWDDAVEEALHASPCLLVVLSPASVKSDNVKDEISFGLENRKTIVPLLYKECAIPLRLKRFQYIDFRVGYEDGFKRLIQALKPVNQLSTRQREKSDRRNFQFSWKLSFRGFSALLSVTLVGIFAIYLVMPKSPTDHPIGNIEESGAKIGRQMAYNLIQTGSEKAWLICTEFEKLNLAEQGLQTSKAIGDPNLEDKLKKQIQGREKNIKDGLSTYSDLLDQLAKSESKIVMEEFDAYAEFLKKKQSFGQIQTTRLMKGHYERHLGGNKNVTASMMQSDCKKVLAEGN